MKLTRVRERVDVFLEAKVDEEVLLETRDTSAVITHIGMPPQEFSEGTVITIMTKGPGCEPRIMFWCPADLLVKIYEVPLDPGVAEAMQQLFGMMDTLPDSPLVEPFVERIKNLQRAVAKAGFVQGDQVQGRLLRLSRAVLVPPRCSLMVSTSAGGAAGARTILRALVSREVG